MKQKSPQEIAKEKKAAEAQAAKDKAAAAKETEDKRVAAVAEAAQVPEAERTAEHIALLKEDEEIKAKESINNTLTPEQKAENAQALGLDADGNPLPDGTGEPVIQKVKTMKEHKDHPLPADQRIKTASDGKSQQIV